MGITFTLQTCTYIIRIMMPLKFAIKSVLLSTLLLLQVLSTQAKNTNLQKIPDLNDLVSQLENSVLDIENVKNEDVSEVSDLLTKLKRTVGDKEKLVLGYKMILKKERRRMLHMRAKIENVSLLANDYKLNMKRQRNRF